MLKKYLKTKLKKDSKQTKNEFLKQPSKQKFKTKNPKKTWKKIPEKNLNPKLRNPEPLNKNPKKNLKSRKKTESLLPPCGLCDLIRCVDGLSNRRCCGWSTPTSWTLFPDSLWCGWSVVTTRGDVLNIGLNVP
jgi:hypothetical protein